MYVITPGAFLQILPTQIANNIAIRRKSTNELQVFGCIEVDRCKTGFGEDVELAVLVVRKAGSHVGINVD
jgi:hypothetical protein